MGSTTEYRNSALSRLMEFAARLWNSDGPKRAQLRLREQCLAQLDLIKEYETPGYDPEYELTPLPNRWHDRLRDQLVRFEGDIDQGGSFKFNILQLAFGGVEMGHKGISSDSVVRRLNLDDNAQMGNALALMGLWSDRLAVESGTVLTTSLLIEMADLACREFASCSTAQEVVHAQSGLKLPIPAPPARYSDRPTDAGGRKPTIEDWMSNEFWRPFKEAKLISAGELKLADLSAYNALYSRARVLATRSARDFDEVKREFFLENGVLSEELMENPPDELKSQVAAIKRSQALRKLTKSTTADEPCR